MAWDAVGDRTRSGATDRAARWPRTPSVFVDKIGLTALLDRREPLTVVRGPRGYGKTSLVSHWIRTLPDSVDVVWVSCRGALGGDDGPAQSLWALIAEAMARTGLLDTASTGDLGRPEVLRVLRDAPRDVCVVVDDFDEVLEPQVEFELLTLLRRFTGLSLVLCMRSVASVETVLAATIDSVVIRPTDLLLTAEETGELAAGPATPSPPTTPRRCT